MGSAGILLRFVRVWRQRASWLTHRLPPSISSNARSTNARARPATLDSEGSSDNDSIRRMSRQASCNDVNACCLKLATVSESLPNCPLEWPPFSTSAVSLVIGKIASSPDRIVRPLPSAAAAALPGRLPVASVPTPAAFAVEGSRYRRSLLAPFRLDDSQDLPASHFGEFRPCFNQPLQIGIESDCPCLCPCLFRKCRFTYGFAYVSSPCGVMDEWRKGAKSSAKARKTLRFAGFCFFGGSPVSVGSHGFDG